MANTAIVKALVLSLERELRGPLNSALQVGTAYFQYGKPAIDYEFTLLSKFSGKITGGYCFSLSRGLLSALRPHADLKPESAAQNFNELQQSVRQINAHLLQAFDESRQSSVMTSLYLPQEHSDPIDIAVDDTDFPVIIPLSYHGHRARLSCSFGDRHA